MTSFWRHARKAHSEEAHLDGFAGDTGFSAKADLGLFRAPAEICPENHPELQTHVKIRPVFLQNGPELQGTRQKPGDRRPNHPELQGRDGYRTTASQRTKRGRHHEGVPASRQAVCNREIPQEGGMGCPSVAW